jgi:hypothetical protein
MASAIDITKPTTGSATTSSVRDNFTFAKDEINELMRTTEDLVTAAGTADALTANFVNDVVLVEGVTVCVKASSSNTSTTPTLNVDATGAKTIVNESGIALVAGNISGSKHYCIFKYDATDTVWVLMNPTIISWPIGSVYLNIAVSTNPSSLLGYGTWVSCGAGKMLIGLDAGNVLMDTVGETGGSADSPSVGTDTGSTALTAAQTKEGSLSRARLTSGSGSDVTIPATGESSGVMVDANSISGAYGLRLTNNASASDGHTHTQTSGTTTDTNYPPYVTVYMWERTA